MQHTPIVTRHLPGHLTELLLAATPYVPPQAIEMLDDMASRAGRHVTVADLADRLVVSPEQVWVHICLLRRALGDSRHDPRYIRTIRLYGNRYAYEYIGPVAESEAA